jgi:hypothetical protein
MHNGMAGPGCPFRPISRWVLTGRIASLGNAADASFLNAPPRITPMPGGPSLPCWLPGSAGSDRLGAHLAIHLLHECRNAIVEGQEGHKPAPGTRKLHPVFMVLLGLAAGQEEEEQAQGPESSKQDRHGQAGLGWQAYAVGAAQGARLGAAEEKERKDLVWSNEGGYMTEHGQAAKQNSWLTPPSSYVAAMCLQANRQAAGSSMGAQVYPPKVPGTHRNRALVTRFMEKVQSQKSIVRMPQRMSCSRTRQHLGR